MSHISEDSRVGGLYILYDGDRSPESNVSVTDAVQIVSDEKDGEGVRWLVFQRFLADGALSSEEERIKYDDAVLDAINAAIIEVMKQTGPMDWLSFYEHQWALLPQHDE